LPIIFRLQKKNQQLENQEEAFKDKTRNPKKEKI